MRKTALLVVFLCFLQSAAWAQAAFTFRLPTSLSVCTDTAVFQLKVTNSGTKDTFSSAKVTYKMPPGFRYVKSSVSGTSVSESNISNLSAPVFSVPTLKPGDSAKFTLKAVADCDVIGYINNSGTIRNLALLTYTGGKDSAFSSTYAVNVPTLSISKISNQSYVGSPGDTFSRRIVFTNTGNGKIAGFTFYIVQAKDVKIDSLKGKKYTQSNDTLKLIFNSTDFKNIGNKDGYLDKSETILLQEYLTVKACSKLDEKFMTTWGCNNKICETYNTTAGVVISQIYPDLKVTPTHYQSTCLNRTLENNQKLTLKNSGNGPAYNVVVDIFQTIYYPGGYYDTVQSRIDENSIKIKYGSGTASKTKADSLFKTTSKPCLNYSGAIGRFIKIIPVIKAGETVELTWDVYSCCAAQGYINTWGYKVDYTEQCKAKNYTTGLQGANYRIYQAYTDNVASTTDLIVNDTVNYSIISTGYNELFPQGSKARLVYELTLPSGVNVRTSGIRLNHYTGSPGWRPSSTVTSGSRLTLTFAYPPPTGFDLSNSYLEMGMAADTSSGKGSCGDVKKISLRVRYTADDTCASCTQNLLLDTFTVKFNCGNPKRVGMQNLSVNVARTSFGLPDNNDDGKPDATGSLNFSKIATDRVMYGDTFKIDFKGIVRVKGTPTIFHHGIADIKFSDDYFEPVGFEVRIVDSANNKVYTCDKMPTYERNGANYRFFFHYDSLKTKGCSTTLASGYRYRSGDSVQIRIFYRVTTNNYGMKKVAVNNMFFFGANPNPTRLRDYYYIDNFPGYINVAGYYHTYYAYTPGQHTGCNTISLMQSYYLSIGPCCANYSGGNLFPYEYRYWSHAKKFKTVLPPGYEYVNAGVYYYPTEGTGKYGTYYSSVWLREKVGDTLFFDIDSLYTPGGGSWYYSDDGYAGTMVVNARATCNTIPGVYHPVIQYQTYEHDSKLSGSDLTFQNYTTVMWQPPNIALQPALKTVNTVTDTFSWTVYLSNNHASADIDKAWLAFYSENKKIEIDSVKLSTGIKYPQDNGVYKLATLKGGETKILKLHARIKTCERDSIKLVMGWNCDDYPDSAKQYKCKADTLVLYADPKQPGVQVRMVSAPDSMYLCDTAKYVVEVANTKTGFASESQVDLLLKPGVKLVKGTSYLEYPVGSKPVKISDPDSLNPFLFRFSARKMSSKIDSFGFSGSTDTLLNTFKIYTSIVTDCEFISGSNLEFAANSYNLCSQQVNASSTVSPPLYLRGAVAPYLSRISIRTGSINACGPGTQLTVKMLNMGNGSTDTADNIFLLLPKGLSLDNSFYKKIKNTPADSTREELIINNQKRISWKLPVGVVSGDSVVFSVWLKADSSTACSNPQLFLQSTTRKALTCISDNSTCYSRIETGRLLQTIEIKKPQIVLSGFSAFAKNNASGGEAITIKINIKNTGDTLKPGKGQLVRFYLDTDGNRKFSSGDKEIGADTITSALKPNSSISLTKTFNIAAGKNCALVAYWDSTGTNCSCTPAQAYLGSIPLRNAGTDTAACFGQAITLGQDSIKGYQYRWWPGSLVADSTKSLTTFTGKNTGSNTQIHRLVLITTRPGNCTVRDTIVVKSYPDFKIDPGYEKTICYGGTANIGGSPTFSGGSTAGVTYIWQPKNGLNADNIANPKASPKQTTWYKLTVVQNGCAKTDSVMVEVLDIPVADAGNDKNICQGDTVKLGGTVVASSGRSPYNYAWSPSTGLSATTATNPNAYPGSTTSYILTVTDANGCKGYDTVTVTVNKNPVADAGKDANICAGDSIKIGGSKAASGGISPYTYIWQPSKGLNDSTAANPYAKPLTTTTYTLTVTDAKGCTNSASVKITVNSLPVAAAGKNREICCGDTVAIGGSPTASGGTGTYTYLWMPDKHISSKTAANPRVFPSATTTYKVKVTDTKGCFSFDSVKITVNALPIIEAGKNDTICETDTLKLGATAKASYKYSWSPGRLMKDSTVLNPYIYPAKNTSFVLTATDAKGCVSKDTIHIFVRSRKALAAPEIKCALVLDSARIQLNWDSIPANIEFKNYKIYRKKGAGNAVLVASITNRGTLTFTDSVANDAFSQPYSYFISTVNKCHVEGKSSENLGTIILKGTQAGDKILNLSWNAPYKGTLKYTLEYNTGSGFKAYDSTTKTNYRLQACRLKANYRIKFVLNSGCTIYSNATPVFELKDTTPPAVNKLLLATADSWNKISLQFDASDSADVKKYKIYRAENKGNFTFMVNVQGKGKLFTYTDANVYAQKNFYTYKISVEDTCGNISGYTTAHTPVLLTGAAGNYQASLQWKPYKGFAIKRQELQLYHNGAWKNIYTFSATDTQFTDAPLPCNIARIYRIKTVGTDSSLASFSDSIIVTPFDTVKPAVPQLNYVTVNPNTGVTLSWQKVADPDVKNYVIYRSGSNSANWQAIDTAGNTSNYTDKPNALQDSIWQYAISALDSCAFNESNSSQLHNTILLKAKVNGCEQAAYLSWNPYINWKNGVQHYLVYRSKANTAEILLDSTTATSWKDTAIDFRNIYTYRVEAVEKKINAKSSSNTINIQTANPGTPEILFATKQNTSADSGRILVKWEVKNPSIYAAYRKLFYRNSRTGSYTLLADNLPLKQDTFLHTGLNTRAGYHDYLLQMIDSCGNVSDSSVIHTPVDITVKIGQLVHTLHWSPYSGWPKNTYVVQKWNGAKFYDLDTIPGNDTSLRKFPAPCNTDIFYRIKSIGPKGQTSYSDTMGGRAIDSIPPNATTLKNVSVLNGKSVQVDFTGADSLDIYAYAIQRSNGSGWTTAGQVLFTQPADNHIFIDKINTWQNQLCYTIITLDSCLNAAASDTFCTIQLGGKEQNLANQVYWLPFKGYNIDTYYVQHLINNNWDTLASVKGNDTAYYHSPLPCNVPVSYRIAGVQHGGYLTLSDSVTLVPFDTIKPQAPVIDFISVLDKQSFRTQWQLSADKDVKLYELQVRSENGSWQVEDTLDRKTTYIVTAKNTLDSAYFFRVVAIDSCADNRSVPATAHKTIQLKGTPKNLASALQWNAYEGFDVKNYVVYRWQNAAFMPIDTVNGNTLGYLDTGLQCNVPFIYKVSALENNGKFISFSDSVSVTPFDTIKPPAPTIHFATVLRNGSIALYWKKSVPDVKLYEIWADDGKGWKVKDTISGLLETTINGLNTAGGNYCFRIAAIDSCAENKSAYSVAHCPVQLNGKSGNLASHLSWSSYKGFSVAKYYIYVYDKKWLKADSVNGSEIQYTHTNLPCNVPVTYKIGALDAGGQFLSYSDSIVLTPFDTIKPAATTLKYAGVLPDRSIEIAWQWNRNTDVKYFEVWRSKGQESFRKIANVVYDSQFVDTQVQPGSSAYRYYIVSVDSCNSLNRSAPSDTDQIMNVQLHTGGCKPFVKLSWSAYTELPQLTDIYEIYRATDGGTFSKIAETNANTRYFTDTLVLADVAYQYKIKAVDSESGYSSFSDTAVAVPWIFPLADSNQIAYTSIRKTGKTNGEILVNWHRYNFTADTFARGYRLYRSTVAAGPYKLIYTTNNFYDTAYIDAGKNTSDSAHFYYVTVYNSCYVNGPASRLHQPVNLAVENRNLASALSWNKYRGEAVLYYEIHRNKNKEGYKKIATLSAGDSAYLDTTVLCKQQYSYQVFAHLSNGKISLSDVETVTSFDTIPPQKPDLLVLSVDKSHARFGEISLKFKGNKEPNRSGYRIFSKALNGSFVPFDDYFHTKADTVAWKEFPISSSKVPFTCFVAALDSCGNISMPSDTHTTVYLSAKAYSGYMQLSWSPYIGFRNTYSYKVERSKDNISWTTISTLPQDVFSLRDSLVECKQFYMYRIVSAEDKTGAVSYSNVPGDTAFETDLPVAAEIKYVTVSAPGTIHISWNASSSKDAAYYHLYRSNDMGKTWEEIAYGLTGTAYNDNGKNTFGTVYQYKILTEDKCGNIAANYSEPHGTIKLRANAGNEKVDVNWNAYLGWAPDAYRVYRDGLLLTTLPGNALTYTDTAVICINTYEYQVLALKYGEDTLFSASNADTAKPYDYNKPQSVYLKTATVSQPNSEVQLVWEPSVSKDVKGYNIYRRNGNTGFYEFVDSTGNTTFTDKAGPITASHCYYIEPYDYCGNTGAWSNKGCLIILFGDAKSGENHLAWNPYEAWKNNTQHYNIYRNDDSSGWRKINTISNIKYTDRAFADTTIAQFCYKVEAVEMGTGEVSFSTVTCLQQQPVVYIPNAFSPGEKDGINDLFAPGGLYIKNYKMLIYNRWGQLVYENNKARGWDGNYRGKPCTVGIYLYRIEIESFNGEKTWHEGTLMLLR